MTNWQFNLRSGFNSDEDDDADSEKPVQSSERPACDPQQHDINDNPSSHHTLPNAANEDSTSKELQELFGTAEEEKVCYKPNPWRIAKMNANARATSERLGVCKPTFKSPWPTKPMKSTKQGGQCQIITPGFTRPGPFASKPSTLKRSKGPSAGLRRPREPSRSLRDSISAALRRGPDATLAVDDSTVDNHNATIIPKVPIPSGSNTPETDVSHTLSDAGTYRFDDRSPQIPTAYPNDGAYISEPEAIMTQNSPMGLPQAQSAAAYPSALDSDGFESHTPALTWGHPSSDGLVSPIEGNFPLTDLQDTSSGTRLRYEYEGSPHNYVTLPSLMDPPSPELNPQHLSGAPASPYLQDELEPSHGNNYDSGYVHGASPAALELSPALQPRIQYAAKPPPQTNYTDMSRVDEYSPDANLREASPIFAYAAPSPTPERLQPSPSRTSTPAHKHSRARELDSNDEDIIPAIRREPITPLQPTRKYTTKSSPWLDPDEEPVWSTLPSRSKKTKQVKTPVTTSRFRLPGAFLGSSSPLGEQESKQLYKPPPRKRSMEQNEDRGKWKVTRIA